MLDRLDLNFASALERKLLLELNGDDQKPGLIRTALNAPDWDTLQRTRGIIHGYEAVLMMMREVAHELNKADERPAHVMGRPN